MRGRPSSRRRLAALTAPALLLVGCADDGTAAPDASSARGVGGTVTVFAASSLTEAFEQIGRDFSAANPDATVTFNFGPSSGLAQSIVAGAPADVFAAANPTTMAVVTEAGDASSPQVFVTNTLQIAVPSDNPGGVTGLADLAEERLKIALCAPQVPCGAASVEVLEAGGIEPAPDTLEQDVKAVLSKVRLGEVDAALVYRTDVLAAGDEVTGIDVPEAAQAVNDYPVAVLAGAPNPEGAAAFVDHVLSAEGQQVLADAGFSRP